MLMADTMAIFFVILGLLFAFPGLWLLCRGLWPQTVANATEVCQRGLIKPLLLGLPITVVIIFISVILGKLGPAGKIGAIALVCIFLMSAGTGVSGLVTCIGGRLASDSDAGRTWRATLRGGIVLELSYLLPILGWFIVLPVSFMIGCGANLIASLSSYSIRKNPSESVKPVYSDEVGTRI